jgi:hypothetical protein
MKEKNEGKKDEKIKFVHILDISIFLIIMISLSIGIMVLGVDIESSDEVKDYSSEFFTEKYANDANEVLLSSTVTRVSYTNTIGNETEYIGYSVNQLILEDVYLRINSGGILNTTSLNLGIESKIHDMARYLIDSKYEFTLTVSTSNIDLFTIRSIENFQPESDVIAKSSKSLLSSDLQEEIDIKLELIF